MTNGWHPQQDETNRQSNAPPAKTPLAPGATHERRNEEASSGETAADRVEDSAATDRE